MSVYVSGVGQIIKTHPKRGCKGACVIHKPSVNLMQGWPTYVRVDRAYLIERLCPHGIGHPDVDSLAYFMSLGPSHASDGVHGCDGCCDPETWEWEA